MGVSFKQHYMICSMTLLFEGLVMADDQDFEQLPEEADVVATEQGIAEALVRLDEIPGDQFELWHSTRPTSMHVLAYTGCMLAVTAVHGSGSIQAGVWKGLGCPITAFACSKNCRCEACALLHDRHNDTAVKSCVRMFNKTSWPRGRMFGVGRVLALMKDLDHDALRIALKNDHKLAQEMRCVLEVPNMTVAYTTTIAESLG